MAFNPAAPTSKIRGNSRTGSILLARQDAWVHLKHPTAPDGLRPHPLTRISAFIRVTSAFICVSKNPDARTKRHPLSTDLQARDHAPTTETNRPEEPEC